MSSIVRRALARGVDFLLAKQQNDGKWEDFASLPVGKSDAWITAYVASGLWSIRWIDGRIDNSVARAADWLEANGADGGGWGYNKRTGPDTDSTAFALKLLSDVGRPLRIIDIEWLCARIQPDGGFATYPDPDAWGDSHPDVTPVALSALPLALQLQRISGVLEYLNRKRRPDGTWPAYWWRTCHYTTFHCLGLCNDYGCIGEPHPSYRWDQADRGVFTTFDLAFLFGSWQMRTPESRFIDELARELVSREMPKGGWQGGFNLRVTAKDCHTPWEVPKGKLYCDTEGLLTTASVVSVLGKQT